MSTQQTRFVAYVWLDHPGAIPLSEYEAELHEQAHHEGKPLEQLAREGGTHKERQTAARLAKKLHDRGPPFHWPKREFDTWEAALRHARRIANEAANSGVEVGGIAVLPRGVEFPALGSRYEDRG